MDSIIENGITIIRIPKDRDFKHGVNGATLMPNGKYRLEISHAGKKYHLGQLKTIEETRELRKTVDEKIADDTFETWLSEVYKPRKNKNGVPGLMYVTSKGYYQMYFGFDSKKFYLGVFHDTEAAARVRKEAEQHKADGTFPEWYEAYREKNNITSNRKG